MAEATDNVEFLKGMYKAFANGDVPTVLAAMDDNIEWNEAEGNPYNLGRPFVGPAAIVEGVFARVLHDIEGFEIRPERFLGDGDTVVMQGRYWGAKAHATGEPLDVQVAHVWDLKDGKAVRFQQYVDTLHFAAALGAD
jgi:ketosteroid isomerase-like protein